MIELAPTDPWAAMAELDDDAAEELLAMNHEWSDALGASLLDPEVTVSVRPLPRRRERSNWSSAE